ncbi:MAG: hypothetical protein ACLTKF_11685 [Subdoligranulum sp.]
MCAVFFIRKIDTVYQNVNQITVVFQTINVALNKVVEKENYFVLCRYPMEDFFFCDVLLQQFLLLFTLFKAVCHCLRVAPGFNEVKQIIDAFVHFAQFAFKFQQVAVILCIVAAFDNGFRQFGDIVCQQYLFNGIDNSGFKDFFADVALCTALFVGTVGAGIILVLAAVFRYAGNAGHSAATLRAEQFGRK